MSMWLRECNVKYCVWTPECFLCSSQLDFLSALGACKVYYRRAGWGSFLSSLIWLLENAFDLMTNIYFYLAKVFLLLFL